MSKKALLIGVSNYQTSRQNCAGLPDLPSVELNLDNLNSVLSDPDRGGFEVESLLNPTKQDMLDNISEFRNYCQEDDLAFVYFSGYGFVITQSDTHIYLATVDSQLPQGNRKSQDNTAVSLEEIYQILQLYKAKNKVLIWDYCFIYGENILNNNLENKFQSIAGLLILHSSSGVNFPNTSVSYFTNCLLNGLYGNADQNRDGIISVQELYEYVNRLKNTDLLQNTKTIIVKNTEDELEISKSPNTDEKSWSRDETLTQFILPTIQVKYSETTPRNWGSSVDTSTLKISNFKKYRLIKDQASIQSRWDILNEKLNELGKADVIENDTSTKFKLKHQIKELTEEKKEIETKLKEIESKLENIQESPKSCDTSSTFQSFSDTIGKYPDVIRWIDGKVMLLVKPQNQKWFYVDKYPVTAFQYMAHLRLNKNELNWKSFWIRHNWPEAGNFPVTDVSVQDAHNYAQSFHKSLPTLQQWCLAASGGIEPITIYPWGNEFDEQRCNHKEYWSNNPNVISKYHLSPEPTSIYQFPPQNSLGVCDIVGNIIEVVYCEEENRWVQTGGCHEIEQSKIQIISYSRNLLPYIQPNRSIGFRCVALLKEYDQLIAKYKQK